MRKALIIARRELVGYFVSPMAYVIGALFLLTSSLWFFHTIFIPDHEATLRPLFEAMAYIMIFAVPLLTMRQLAEEASSGTIETLMTAPVSETQVIAGKFMGVMGFYLALLAATLLLLLLMAFYGQPDLGLAAMGYLGMILLGAMFVAAGLFVSTLTNYQLVAAIGGTALCAGMALLPKLLIAGGFRPWSDLASAVNVMAYLEYFASGWFDSRGVVLFLTVAAVLLFLSVKALESKRWR